MARNRQNHDRIGQPRQQGIQQQGNHRYIESYEYRNGYPRQNNSQFIESQPGIYQTVLPPPPPPVDL